MDVNIVVKVSLVDTAIVIEKDGCFILASRPIGNSLLSYYYCNSMSWTSSIDEAFGWSTARIALSKAVSLGFDRVTLDSNSARSLLL